MTPVTCFAGRRVALFGLGGSGLVTALALQAGGATVVACDDNPAKMAEAAGRGVGTGDLREGDWSSFDALLLSPGVPLSHPEPHWSAKLARDAGVEIIGDIELFCRERAAIAPSAPFVAITGTNGKSTTTALTAHLLRSAGLDVQMGGNIGTAVLALEPPGRGRYHVVEMSSFQIDLTPSLSPTIGVHLNLSPDHLDRHGTMENYAEIKERLVAGAASAVVGIDDEASAAIARRRSARPDLRTISVVEEFPTSSMTGLRPDLFAKGSRLYAWDPDWDPGGQAGGFEDVADLTGIGSLRGAHNAQNACAAVQVAILFGLEPEEIRAGLASFPGLAHRMELVARRGRALFVNDSKATNADSAEKALLSFRDIHWILGGKAKAGGVEPLLPHLDRVAKAYLVGEATEDFAATLEGRVPFERCGTLDRAVAAAAEAAARSDAPEPVVLLSPACASYDQYPNFEKRGDHFRELVRALPGVEVKGS